MGASSRGQRAASPSPSSTDEDGTVEKTTQSPPVGGKGVAVPGIQMPRLVRLSFQWALSFLTTGTVFGVPGLALMLDRDCMLTELCDYKNTTSASAVADLPPYDPERCELGGSEDLLTCNERVSRLVLLGALGIATVIAGHLPGGIFVDWAGPRASSVTGGSFFTLGLVGLALTLSRGWEAGVGLREAGLLEISWVLMGLGGVGVHMGSFHLTMLYPARRHTVMTSFVACFAGSGINFAILEQLHAVGVPSVTLFSVYACLTGILSVSALFWQPRRRLLPPAQPDAPADAFKCDSDEEKVANDDSLSSVTTATSSSSDLSSFDSALEADSVELLETAEEFDSEMGAGGIASRTPLPPLPNFLDRPVLKQYQTATFAVCTLWLTMHMFRYSLYVNVIKPQNAFLANGDIDMANRFTAAAAWTLPVAMVVAVPITGTILDKYGTMVGWIAGWITAVLYSIVSAIPVLAIQPLSWLLYGFSRTTILSSFFALIMISFGPKSFGRAAGACMVVAGSVSLLQVLVIPAVVAENSYTALHLGTEIPLGLALLAPWFIRREALAQLKLKSQHSAGQGA